MNGFMLINVLKVTRIRIIERVTNEFTYGSLLKEINGNLVLYYYY